VRFLITGSYGFLGYSLARRLLEDRHVVVGIDRVANAVSEKKYRVAELKKFERFKHAECDLSDFKTVEKVVTELRPHHVMHFAAQYAVAPLNLELLHRYISSNCLGFVNVLEACRRAEVKRFNYASSTFVDDHAISTHTYGATKRFNEEMASVYSHTYGMETLGLRYGSTFGPLCRPDVGAYKAALRMFSGKPHPMKGGYLYKTAFLWSEDAVDLTRDLLLAPLPQKHNVLTLVMDDKRYSLLDLARMMHAKTGRPFEVAGKLPAPVDGGTPVAQLEQLEAVLGRRPAINMEEAVARFVDWFDGHYKSGLA
jgi:UDP-glucuronate 4-epimerase